MSKLLIDITNIEDLFPNKNLADRGIPRLFSMVVSRLITSLGLDGVAAISFNSPFCDYELSSIDQVVEKYPVLHPGLIIFQEYEDILIDLDNGDVILFLSRPPDLRHKAELLNYFTNEYSIKFCTLVHDLMPYFMPESFDECFSNYFTGTYNVLIKFSHTLLFYSEQTKNDLLKFFPASNLESRLIRVHLGADIQISDGEIILYDIEQTLKNKQYIIYVSSLAPRKNHHLLIYVWFLLLEKYGEDSPYLVLVGDPIKNKKSLQNTLDLISRNPQLSKKIIFASRVNNKTLKWLYENSLFSIFPSFYEGWGLPVSESLSLGKFCISSDKGSLKETGGDFVEYFSPYDSGELFRLICKFYDTKNLLIDAEKNIQNNYHKPLWDNCALEISDIITELLVTKK